MNLPVWVLRGGTAVAQFRDWQDALDFARMRGGLTVCNLASLMDAGSGPIRLPEARTVPTADLVGRLHREGNRN